MMKKGIFILLSFILLLPLFGLDNYVYPAIEASAFIDGLPEELYGIWEGKDRYIFFEKLESEELKGGIQGNTQETEANLEDENKTYQVAQIVVILKEYYGWYLDRAAEPEEYADREKRIRNTGTTRKANEIYITADYLYPEYPENHCYNLLLNYTKHQKRIVPFTILDDKIYLNFFVELPYFDEEIEKNRKENYKPSSDGLYLGNHLSTGFTLSDETDDENIGCLYITGNKMYDVRYWKTTMEYQGDSVTFTYGEDSFPVSRHLISGENNYSCVSGRSKKIRNPQPPFLFNEENYLFNIDKTVIIMDKEPYLKKLADKNTFEALMQLVKEGNSRRKPDPPPLFPVKTIDEREEILKLFEENHQMFEEIHKKLQKLEIKN